MESKTASVEANVAVQHAQASTLRRWVTIAGVGLIAMIVAADSYEAWQDYRTAVADNQRAQVALCRALAEQTDRMVQEIDLVLTDYAQWRESPQGAQADEQALRDRLRTRFLQLPFIQSAALASRDGRLLASTRSDLVGDRSLQTREVFTVPERAQDDSLYIGKPFIGHRDGTRSFALSRRINAPNGEFDGIVVARISFEYLASLYSRVSTTSDTSIRLVRGDGTVLAEYPVDARSMDHLPAADHMLTARPTASEESETVHSAAGTLVVARNRIGQYPMTLQVSRSMSDVLHPWLQQEAASAIRTLTLAILAALLLVGLRNALARHEREEVERRRLERELESVHRAEALGFLAASVAHDFNNVLTAIVGYAELSKKSIAPGSSAATNVERLLSATERARLLVRKVLTFDVHRSVNYQPLLLEPVVDEVLHQIQATLPASIALKVAHAREAVTILGDATEVHQVIMNLCSNAIHAMPDGGTLEISIDLFDVLASRDLALGKLHAGPWVRMSIRDTGVGMAQDHVKTAFEPFYTTRQPGQGTGIGMTVVRNILMRMNGALDVESQLGVGTRMSLYWPRISPSNETPRQLAADGGGETILIVDDEPELVALAEETLALMGYEPIGYSDPRAAQDAFRRDPGRFDAVLTDERMPSLRGLDLAESIRTIDTEVPIILMTGHRDGEVNARAKSIGISEILDKPLRAEALRMALRRRLAATKAN